MFKKWLIIILGMSCAFTLFAQSNPTDSFSVTERQNIKEELDDLDDISLDELDRFLDSILSPRSYYLAGVQFGKGYYNYESKTGYLPEVTKRITYSPLLGYYHKSGLGISASGYLINDDNKLNLFQGSISPSFDYLGNRNLATGITFTHYFTKDSLPFYTSPLQKELYLYFTWRKFWVKPSVSLTYGWGSRSDYEERKTQIRGLRLRRNGFTRIETTETVKDLSIMVSLRHDFYWLNVAGINDHIRITPQLAFTSGTQQFGFNQTADSYLTAVRNGTNIMYNSESSELNGNTSFQPLSLALFLRGEYAIGKFFIQPRVVFDYYFPAAEKNFNTLFSLNTGFMF